MAETVGDDTAQNLEMLADGYDNDGRLADLARSILRRDGRVMA